MSKKKTSSHMNELQIYRLRFDKINYKFSQDLPTKITNASKATNYSKSDIFAHLKSFQTIAFLKTYWRRKTQLIELVILRPFLTFFANCINIFHKTEVQMFILMCLKVRWFRRNFLVSSNSPKKGKMEIFVFCVITLEKIKI